MTTRFFNIEGKVQKVMFRQTVIRGLLKRNLRGGASNDKTNKNLVHLTIYGENPKIDEFIKDLKRIKPLNNWKAQVEKVTELKEGIAIENLKVTTENVDTFDWKKDVTMYL